MRLCHRCSKAWAESDPPGFNNTCEGCGMPLHACANCSHYRPNGRHRCALPGTDDVLDAAAPNRCTSFEFSEVVADAAQADGPPVGPTRDIKRDRWDKLFG